MRIGLLQTAGVADDLDATVDALADALVRAEVRGVDLLVTPEMWSSGYAVGDRVAALAEPADGPLAERLGELARRHGVALAYGFPERTGGTDAPVFDSVQLLGRDGARLACYRKTHLYGDLDRSLFSPGGEAVVTADLPLAAGSVRIGLLVCYDIEFPETARLHALAGTELLVVPTGLMTPYDEVAQRVVPVRALENGLALAYVNRVGTEGELTYCGQSVLVGPAGVDLARAERGERLLVVDLDLATVGAARAATPYLRDRRPDLYSSIGPGGTP